MHSLFICKAITSLVLYNTDTKFHTNLHKWYRNWECEREKKSWMSLSDNLKWNAHIGEIVRKANKWLFFLRPIVEYIYMPAPYGMPVCVNTYWRRWTPFKGQLWLQSIGWHHMKNICVQVVWYPSKTRVRICSDLFNEMCKPDHKLNPLIPKPHECSKSLRNAPPIDPPKFRTNCYRDAFIPYALMNFQ